MTLEQDWLHVREGHYCSMRPDAIIVT